MEFLKLNKRFSFKLDGKNIWEMQYSCKTTEKDGVYETVYSFEGGLVVTNIAKKHGKYGSYEWVNYIENTSDKATGIISELWDCECTLPLENDAPEGSGAYISGRNHTKIYNPTGSICEIYDFYSNPDDDVKYNRRTNHIFAGETKEYSCYEGRSSDGRAPFFNVNRKDGGYIFAIGWTGQWNCEITRGDGNITFRSKIEDTHFRVFPGEKFRTSSVVIMEYHDGVINAQNKWRRLVKEHFSLIGKEGREKYGPLCASIWGGMKSSSVLERIDVIKNKGLPFEYIWIDAGWYGADTVPSPDEFSGNWYSQTGDWRVSRKVHPNGMEDITKKLHDAGMKFLLWVEPERVLPSAPIVSAHPEYFLSHGEIRVDSKILNLGNRNAWNYCFETLSQLFEKLQVDCYRQDFNISPLAFWRKYDDADRVGITEIKHINGLYSLWDSLLERFPSLIIDNCSSGGRRIDIETLRRSIPMWRSDYQCNANPDPHATQAHMLSYNMWMPYSGTGAGRLYDGYCVRSAYGQSLNLGYLYSENECVEDENKISFIRKYIAEYFEIRPYLSEDFYPLTEFSDKLDTWCAMQYDRPEMCDGVIQIFRRDNSPYESAVFKLCGIKEDKEYLFSDADGGEFTVSGKELCENGFSISIPERRSAKIYFYKAE